MRSQCKRFDFCGQRVLALEPRGGCSMRGVQSLRANFIPPRPPFHAQNTGFRHVLHTPQLSVRTGVPGPRRGGPSGILAAVADDPGVMGNLPRSRPGRRSDKRSSGASGGARKAAGSGSTRSRSSASAASRAGDGASAKAAAEPSVRKASAGRGSTTAARAERGPARPAAGGPDPVGDALKVAGKVAGAGLGIAVEVLRRLPKP